MARHRLFDAKRSGKWFVRVHPNRRYYLSWHGALFITGSDATTPFVLNGTTATHFYPVS